MKTLHMSIADFLDGSSFEIWVVNPRKAMIVPGPKCSTAALLRFTNHIMEYFDDRFEVREYQRTKED